MVDALRRQGAPFGPADAEAVAPTERPPVEGTFLGRRVVSMGPPSSGGLVLLEWLQAYERARQRLPAAPRMHLWLEAARLSHFDRAHVLGDPDAVAVPSATLLAPAYADAQAARIRADAPLALPADVPSPAEGQHTTHLSIVDGRGLAVAMTLSLNLSFGAGIVVPGTGVLLNDQMDDFYTDQVNAFGLAGSARNAPAAGRRPLSSMTPTMVFEQGRLRLVLGSPGGSHIPTAVASVLRGVLEDGLAPDVALHADRIHHQWFPDHAEVEPNFRGDLLPEERRRAERPRLPIGNVQLLEQSAQGWRAFSDCRGRGAAWAGVVPLAATAPAGPPS
jgi:gamma-glutamyltranspeptidase/glutathione hydrolase